MLPCHCKPCKLEKTAFQNDFSAYPRYLFIIHNQNFFTHAKSSSRENILYHVNLKNFSSFLIIVSHSPMNVLLSVKFHLPQNHAAVYNISVSQNRICQHQPLQYLPSHTVGQPTLQKPVWHITCLLLLSASYRCRGGMKTRPAFWRRSKNTM